MEENTRTNEETITEESANELKKQSFFGFVWRFIQNTSSQIIAFVIQIVLARLLTPDDYGIISLTAVFITISNVFVQNGLTSALVQKKEIDECEKSSMFYLSIVIGVVLYFILFFLSPLIASFYNIESISSILRIQSISLIFSSLSSVSVALIQRNLKFKKTFFISIIGYIFQGGIGIFLAYKGYGVWALVWGTLAYNFIYSFGNIIFCKWWPKLMFSFKKVKTLLVYSSNILFSNLISAIFTSSRTLIVGKYYDSQTLGLYDRGNQFPTALMTGFDGAFSTVLYSSLSKVQDDKERLVRYLRKSIRISLTISAPLMFGLAAVAKPTILLLLTEKWVECVPFLMIYCFICVMWPLSAKTQALNAYGKSKVTFITNIITVIINIAIMFICIQFGIMVFAVGTLIGNFIGVVLSAIVSKKYLDYGIWDQIVDCAPAYLVSGAMFGVVYSLSLFIGLAPIFQLLILVPIGIIVYTLLSFLFKIEGFMFIVNVVKARLKRNKSNELKS